MEHQGAVHANHLRRQIPALSIVLWVRLAFWP